MNKYNGWKFFSGDERLRGEGGLYQVTDGRALSLEDRGEGECSLEDELKRLQGSGVLACIKKRKQYFAVFRRDNFGRIVSERGKKRKQTEV